VQILFTRDQVAGYGIGVDAVEALCERADDYEALREYIAASLPRTDRWIRFSGFSYDESPRKSTRRLVLLTAINEAGEFSGVERLQRECYYLNACDIYICTFTLDDNDVMRFESIADALKRFSV